MVTSTIVIEAAGARILHGGGPVPYRAFAVGEGGDLTLHEIHVKGFEVHGGNGFSGGGGGMGAGGAVYVQGGALSVGWSTFEQNSALGGDGRTPTMQIRATSPAINAADAGTSEPDDQRGPPRPQGGGFDIGAYEAADSAPTTTIALTPDAPNGLDGWYRTAVAVTITAVDGGDPAPSTRCGLNLSNSPTSFDDLPDVACTPFNGRDGQRAPHGLRRKP
jgi:hypothetical protein